MHSTDIAIESSARRWLRIAVVTETYPPEVNGVAGTIARVVEGLRERGHELQLIRPRQGPDDVARVQEGFAEMLMRGLPIPRYPELKMGLPAKRALVRRWSFERPDVVHLATEGPLGWSALQAARHLRLPVVSEFRTNFHAYSQHYGVGWLRHPILAYLRKFHNQCQRTLAPAPDLRDQLTDQGFQRVFASARGVDTQRFRPERRSTALRRQWGADEGAPVLICVGRLAAEKNLGTAVDAFEALRQVEPRAKLVFVGDGPERERLQARCPDAVFAGLRRGDDLAAHYASADLFVFPSLTETFGNVVPEAMACGLPVVAYHYAAAAVLLQDHRAGALAPMGDAEAFVRAVVDLGRLPTALRALGREAHAVARTLGWDRIVAEVEGHHRAAMADLAPDLPAALHLA
ncbi:glycosyltransferase family 4 protein [Inhella crocodyli]|jgi:glycosyltransferase involved in cell wall biosynthesis|uniref:Glycosyltransferase family 1 protein n=1 Tax=Inhella crocodyli TaxID=2499851 RepID=A0A3S3T464_9BURK|nr:glycosyltransferase family 1 protein [Inhella crocodyli]RVT82987.1 glycosyltransferase family 1 protein [Inhella crocodyli]